MRAVVTGDWQAAWSNLSNCETILDQVLQVCRKRKIKNVLHLGDLKQHYSPVDVRVVNFGVKFVTTLRAEGITPFILLGNHDRVSMSIKSDNWFPALRAAGAITISRPRYFAEYDLAAVPYTQDYKTARRWFRKVAQAAAAAATGRTVLLFHHEVAGSKLNVTTDADTRLRLADLRTDTYRWCVGGHIHLFQSLCDNAVYVGSPFAHDWGEANQRKGIVVIDEDTLSFIRSPIPGMYDPTLPNFKESKPKSWDGASVRVHVVCDKDSTTNYQAVVEKAKHAALKRYAGAEVSVVPQFIDHVDEEAIEHDGTDESIVKTYVDKTCPRWMLQRKASITRRLLRLLAAQGALRTSHAKIRFISAEAQNFLSFKQVSIRYRPGITVITGRNMDWPGRNNGCGKTSLLQLPSVAFFGSTLKGQASDRWTTRNSDSLAYVRFKFKIGDKLCEIYRQRRPGKLQFTIAGVEQNVGIGIRGTQDAIQNATGLSWETLRNAVYIDQAEVSLLLRGTDVQRKSLFSKFLNLERFERARAAAAALLSNAKQAEHDAQFSRVSCRQRLAELKQTRKDMAVADVRAAKSALAVARKAGERKLAMLKTKAAKLTPEAVRAAWDAVSMLSNALSRSEAKREVLAAAISKRQRLADAGKCPTCGQAVAKAAMKSSLRKDECELLELDSKIKNQEVLVDTARSEAEEIEFQYRRSTREAELESQKHVAEISKAEAAYLYAVEQQEVASKLDSRIAAARRALRKSIRVCAKAANRVHLFEYVVRSFGKDGIPAYLAAGLCPALNSAAVKYSELFTDNELQVRFATAGSDIDVSVVNVHGGEAIEDQSQGETRLAGLVTGFALRESISPCSMLILDEPSESLDAVNAKAFAEGLRQVAKDLGSVLITSHNPWILGELGSERKLEIRKRNGISRITGV